MRKILSLLILPILFISCSSDDIIPDPNNGENSTIDEKILGKWKVEYSKKIEPAVYNETTGKVEYNEDAIITEYEGDWGKPGIIPESGMFDNNEIAIEIKNDNNIIVSIGGGNPKPIGYKIENGYLKRTSNIYKSTMNHKYSLKDGILTVELIGLELVDGELTPHLDYYKISRYSKITE